MSDIASMIDRGYELKSQLKSLTDESDAIKKELREHVEQSNQDLLGSGESIPLNGNLHKVKVCLSENSFSISPTTTPNEIRRMKAIIADDEIMSLQEGVKIKDGVSLRKIKEIIGDEFYNLFEEDLQVKIDAKNMTQWIKKNNRTASVGENISEFVSKKLDKTPNTAKVTFSK